MPRFFLHLHECGSIVIDEEGVELPDRDAAHRAAVRSARDVMCAEVAEGRLCLGCCIEVQDEEQRLVERLPFREAVSVSGF